MAEIIQRVEKTNIELMKKEGLKRTLVMSRISSVSASLNAVPSECEVYLDRRMVPGESEEAIRQEMDKLVEGKNPNSLKISEGINVLSIHHLNRNEKQAKKKAKLGLMYEQLFMSPH